MTSVSRTFLFIFFWLFTLLSFSCVQKIYLDPIQIKFFPNPDELKPDLYEEVISFLYPKETTKQQENVQTDEILDSGNNYIYLKNFYDKLYDLEKNKDKVVRILHFGDSIIWADIVTSKLKTKFQADFGDGGRGAVPAFYKLERAFLNHGNPTSESYFIREKAKPWGSPNHNIGFLGETFIPSYPGSTSIQVLGNNQNPWVRAGMILRPRGLDSPVTININHTGGNVTKSESLPSGNCEIYEYPIPKSNKVSFNFEGTPSSSLPFIDTFFLETSYGISYSPVSVMGLELNDQLISDEDKFECGMNKFKPDLIVLQYGVNESQNLWLSNVRTTEFYKNSTKKVLNRFREKSNNADILIIGPVERIRQDSSGNFITMPEMMKIRDVYKTVAKEHKVAFYDSFLAMGGAGKNKELFQKGIIQQDRTHLTRAGGDYLADLFYIDFYNQYQKYLGYQNTQREKKKESEIKENNRAVNFTSKAYLYFFSLVFISIYIINKFPYLKVIFLLSYSYYFYMSWNIYPIVLLLFSTITDYFLAIKIESCKKSGSTGKQYLILSLFFNLGLLFIFKYLNFTIDIFNNFISLINSGSELDKLDILLPVGISFYTFQTLSYTLDVYKGNMSAEHRFFRFALFVTFFPQLVAGPIVRANHFLPFLNPFVRHFSPTYEKFSTGVFFIFNGLFKKLGADWIGANLVDRVYSAPDMYSSLEILAGIYGYAFQIYGDFSGYTDIAIGSAMILGFNLTENFNRPYQSSSITEFWRRWHISLGSWFRDYLYISLGGNRNHVYTNLLITMFLCGLWHGASYNFVLWGVYHGVFLALERKFNYPSNLINRKYYSLNTSLVNINSIFIFTNIRAKFQLLKSNINRYIKYNFHEYLRIFITFHIVVVGWLLFRMESFESSTKMIDIVLSFSLESPNLDIQILLVLGLFSVLHFSPTLFKNLLKNAWLQIPSSSQGIFAGILSIGLYNISLAAPRAFIYFQF